MPRLLARSAIALAFSFAAHAALAADLTVSAAASLTNAFKDIAAAYEAQNPGTKVLLNFGASGTLLQQMLKGGAPVDVFASADEATMDDAQKQQLVKAEDRQDFVRNALVVIVPHDAATLPTALKDLQAPSIKHIAIGQPASVPVGRYTKAVLEKAGLWSSLESKFVDATSVRQALDYVARGEVEAGFVYATDAALTPDKVKQAFAVLTETPVLYPIAPLAASPNAAEARKFIAYVMSAPGQAVLAKYGFAKP
jgi:molybdate transport system substrate-binding protein